MAYRRFHREDILEDGWVVLVGEKPHARKGKATGGFLEVSEEQE